MWNIAFLTAIPTYSLLQDAIEMMFGRIRACGGFNNNPNVYQFKGAFRKIQANTKVGLSEHSNCRVFDSYLPDNHFYSNIYFVTSARPKICMDQSLYDSQKDAILNKLNESQSAKSMEAMSTTHHMLDGSADFMTVFIASSIENKIMNCNSFHCESCRFIFCENQKLISVDTEYLKWQPCISTVDICKISEKFFKLHNLQNSKPQFDFKVLYCLIFRSMNFDLLYSNSKFECNLNHKYQFIKCIVGQYISIRANQIAKQATLAPMNSLIRQQYNHLVLFSGQ